VTRHAVPLLIVMGLAIPVVLENVSYHKVLMVEEVRLCVERYI
jgi:hypothetical protein